MPEHKRHQKGLGNGIGICQIPERLCHADLEELRLRDLVLTDDLLHAGFHIRDRILIHRIPQIDRSHVQAHALRPGRIDRLNPLRNREVRDPACRDFHHDVALLPDTGNRLLQEGQIRCQMTV